MKIFKIKTGEKAPKTTSYTCQHCFGEVQMKMDECMPKCPKCSESTQYTYSCKANAQVATTKRCL